MRFIYFLQEKGLRGFLVYIALGILITGAFTVVGIVSNKYQLLEGYLSVLFLWQSELLWLIVRSNFLERNQFGEVVYAGLPFFYTWIIGILIGIPIYAFSSMVIHYIWSQRNQD